MAHYSRKRRRNVDSDRGERGERMGTPNRTAPGSGGDRRRAGRITDFALGGPGMSGKLQSSAGEADANRDDRTRRTLELLVGADRADVSLTHFSAGRVEVHVSEPTLQIRNGFIAVVCTVNMLSRFVGTVELIVAGQRTAALQQALDVELARIRRIDTRPGRSVLLTWLNPGPPASTGPQAAARVWVGEPAPSDIAPEDRARDVSITFDGWACQL